MNKLALILICTFSSTCLFAEPIPDTPVTELPSAPVQETDGQRRQRLKLEANQLWRVRIACMNPNRRDHDGEIFTAGNGGSIKIKGENI